MHEELRRQTLQAEEQRRLRASAEAKAAEDLRVSDGGRGRSRLELQHLNMSGRFLPNGVQTSSLGCVWGASSGQAELRLDQAEGKFGPTSEG